MSTYNSKFSGAEIDALLEKVKNGQVESSGGGVSEKEAFAKELGATHKHKITVSVSPEAGITISCTLYNKDATKFTVGTMTTYISNCMMTVNGFYGLDFGTTNLFIGDAKWGIGDVGEGNEVLMVSIGGYGGIYSYAKSVDFENQTTDEGTISAIVGRELMPVQMIIDEMGGTFTDDVTEL